MSKSKFKVIKVANVNEWFAITEEVGKSSVTSSPAFIDVIADVFNMSPVLTVVYYADKPVQGCVLYRKGNSIIHPFSNLYSAVWVNSSSDLLIQEAMLFWLTELTKSFKRIEFNLPPEIADVRVFYQVGFKAYTFYTYINNLESPIEVKPKIRNWLKRAEKQEIKFRWNDQSVDLIQQHIDSFKGLGYKQSYVNKIERLIKKLTQIDALIAVSAREEDTGVLLASAYILSDYHNKEALNLLLTSGKNHYNTGVHSAMYFKNLHFLQSKGYHRFDLCGATTLGIGNFKSNFKGDLTPFYVVKFSRLRWECILMTRTFTKLIAVIRSVIFSNRRV